ncbi:unnamed protein product [Ixodes persulcatus]
MYPLSFRWTRKRGPHIILIIWVVAGLLSSVQFVHGRATEFTWAGGTYYDCNENWEESSGKVYTAVIFTVTFMTPMLALTFTYTSIGWKMWRHTSPGNADVQRDQQQFSAKMKVSASLCRLMRSILVCHIPAQLPNNVMPYLTRNTVSPTTVSAQALVLFVRVSFESRPLSLILPLNQCLSPLSELAGVDLRQLALSCCPSLAAKAGRALNKRSSYGGGSLRSSTVIVSSAGGGASSLHQHHQRCNGFSSVKSPTSVVALKTLGSCVVDQTPVRFSVYE